MDPKGVKEVNKRLRRNPQERREAAEHVKRDFFDYVESNFELAPDQRDELRSIPDDLGTALGHAIAATLEHNGEVQYSVVPGSPAISYEVNGKVGAGGAWEVGGKVTYSK
jgi:hypothetical protein